MTALDYSTTAPLYRTAGWKGALPLPLNKKSPPPDGFTGDDGRWPTEEDRAGWKAKRGGVGLRLPDGIIGIDVDHYDSKTGGDDLRALEQAFGPLPATWISTARSMPSGIRLYRVPTGIKFVGEASKNIEIIQRHHRYVAAWPTFNAKAGAVVRWITPDGEIVDRPPRPDELAELPAAWVEGLRADRPKTNAQAPTLGGGDSPEVMAALGDALAGLARGGCRHAAARDGSMILTRYVEQERPGAEEALAALHSAFLNSVSGDGTRSAKEAEAEWERLVNGAADKVDATPSKKRTSRPRGAQQHDQQHDETGAPPDPTPSPDGWHLTEHGNALRFADANRNQLRYVATWNRWIAWDTTRYADDHDAIRASQSAATVAAHLWRLVPTVKRDDREATISWAKRSESASTITATLRLGRAIPGMAIDHEALDRDHWLLNIENGTLNLKDGTLRPHNPADLLRKKAPVGWRTDATAPLFHAFLAKVQPEPEVRAYLQRLVGYCLTGDVSEHHIVFHIGHGGNGKSVFLAILRALLGDYAGTAARDLVVLHRNEPHPTSTADLFGLRLAVAVETQDGARLDESKVKELTGGDRVKARRMREDFWEFDPTHKLWLVANYRPAIRGGDHGVWRRVRLVDWPVTITEEEKDRTLADRIIRTELPGVLAWAVEGCLAWQRHGLQEPASVLASTAAYKAEQDVLAGFLDDEGLVLDPDDGRLSIPAAALRAKYETWCQANGQQPVSPQSLGRQLTARGCEAARRRNGTVLHRVWLHVGDPTR